VKWSASDVAGALGLPETTIHTFLKDAKDYEAKNMTTLRHFEVIHWRFWNAD
jgi:hypothetical protein